MKNLLSNPSADNDSTPEVFSRLQRLWRFFLFLLTEVRRDRLNLRSAALTYSVVLSLVPTLALSTAILKGMGAGDQMHQAAYRLIDNLNAGNVSHSHPAPAATAGNSASSKESANSQVTSPPAAADANDFSGHLYRAVDQVFDYVNRTNFAALGAIGTFLLLFAVLVVINGIEEAMNAIWGVAKSRGPGQKFMNYMALLLICPLTVNLGIGAVTMLNTPAVTPYLNTLVPLAWARNLLFKLLPFFLLTLTFVVLYMFLPNTRVKVKAAWIGGAAGAIGLIILQKAFIYLQLGVANYNAIYGSFATVPLFLLWLNSAWLVFLLGAEVAYCAQHARSILEQKKSTGLPADCIDRLSLAFDLMNRIYLDFDQRCSATVTSLSRDCDRDDDEVAGLLEKLVTAGLLHRGQETPSTFLPTAPAEKIPAAEISRLILNPDSAESPDSLEPDKTSLGQRLSRTFLEAGHQSLPKSPWLSGE